MAGHEAYYKYPYDLFQVAYVPDEVVLEREKTYYVELEPSEPLMMFADDAVWEFAPSVDIRRWMRVEGKENARRMYHAVYASVGDVRTDPVLRSEFVITRHYPPGTSYIMLNHQRPIFKDVRVRRALAKLFDVSTIVEKIMHGLGRPAGALYWFRDPDYNESIAPVVLDPPGARRLLAEAGWGDSDGDAVLDKGGQALRFTFYLIASSPTHKLWLTIYQQELRKAGIAMEISPIDWSAYLARIRKHA